MKTLRASRGLVGSIWCRLVTHCGEIAVSARPENATLEQTMIATAAMNRDAFAGGNINGLRGRLRSAAAF